MLYLLRLSELELIERERRMIERRIRAARFPAAKSLDSFDFKAMACLNKPLVMELARCQCIEVYDRKGLCYPSDLTDPEWAPLAPLLAPAKRGGRKREVDLREVMNGILYVLGTGCQWRALPKDLLPKSTVHDYLMLWEWDGTLDRIHHEFYVMTRELEGREASPELQDRTDHVLLTRRRGVIDRVLRTVRRLRRAESLPHRQAFWR